MRIPLLTRGRVQRASPADRSLRHRFFRFAPLPKFRNPLPHPARVALFTKRFSASQSRAFKTSDTPSIQTFRPDLIAAPLSALRELHESVAVRKAIVVFTDSCSSPLPESAREWIWQRFAVPCFEQLLNARGEVIAEECQVHDGLHVLRPDALSGSLTSAECDCGRNEPRLTSTLVR